MCAGGGDALGEPDLAIADAELEVAVSGHAAELDPRVARALEALLRGLVELLRDAVDVLRHAELGSHEFGWVGCQRIRVEEREKDVTGEVLVRAAADHDGTLEDSTLR